MFHLKFIFRVRKSYKKLPDNCPIIRGTAGHPEAVFILQVKQYRVWAWWTYWTNVHEFRTLKLAKDAKFDWECAPLYSIGVRT